MVSPIGRNFYHCVFGRNIYTFKLGWKINKKVPINSLQRLVADIGIESGDFILCHVVECYCVNNSTKIQVIVPPTKYFKTINILLTNWLISNQVTLLNNLPTQSKHPDKVIPIKRIIPQKIGPHTPDPSYCSSSYKSATRPCSSSSFVLDTF